MMLIREKVNDFKQSTNSITLNKYSVTTNFTVHFTFAVL